MLQLIKVPTLVLHFYYTLFFFMILFVTVAEMLMILPNTQIVITYLICGNNQAWLLNLNLTNETLYTGARSGLLISMLENFNLFYLISLKTLVLLMFKWMCLLLKKSYPLRYWDCLSLLNWTATVTISLLLTLLLRNDSMRPVLTWYLPQPIYYISHQVSFRTQNWRGESVISIIE